MTRESNSNQGMIDRTYEMWRIRFPTGDLLTHFPTMSSVTFSILQSRTSSFSRGLVMVRVCYQISPYTVYDIHYELEVCHLVNHVCRLHKAECSNNPVFDIKFKVTQTHMTMIFSSWLSLAKKHRYSVLVENIILRVHCSRNASRLPTLTVSKNKVRVN